MKKLMIAVAIAIMAVASQAYQIQWGARNMYIPVANDVKISQSGIVAASGDAFAANALTVQLYWIDSNSTHNYIGSYKNDSAGSLTAVNLGDASSELYSAMVADSGTAYKPSYYFTATYTTADGTYVYTGTTTAGKTLANINAANITATAKFSTAGTWDYTAASGPEPVPEPTSGLLLLLGMAGLALRRRA